MHRKYGDFDQVIKDQEKQIQNEKIGNEKEILYLLDEQDEIQLKMLSYHIEMLYQKYDDKDDTLSGSKDGRRLKSVLNKRI